MNSNERCKDEDTQECEACQELDDELAIILQRILDSERKRIKGNNK